MEWRDEYICGITEVDEDHKKFFNLVNTYKSGGMDDHSFLDATLKHMKLHFFREEAILLKNDYDEWRHHDEIHTRILKGLADAISKCKSGDMTVPDFLRKFEFGLVHHIVEDDKKHCEWLIAKGRKNKDRQQPDTLW